MIASGRPEVEGVFGEEAMSWWMLLVFTIALSGIAKADWQYTKWGMTPEQVVAASGGKAKLLHGVQYPPPHEILAGSETTVRDMPLSVNFLFRGRKLTEVHLGHGCDDAREAATLQSALYDRFGRPVRDERGDNIFQAWRDEKSGDVITFLYVPKNLCAITYTPRPEGL